MEGIHSSMRFTPGESYTAAWSAEEDILGKTKSQPIIDKAGLTLELTNGSSPEGTIPCYEHCMADNHPSPGTEGCEAFFGPLTLHE